MKIFTSEDIAAIERRTVETDGISTLDLLARAAEGVAGEIASRWRPARRTAIFAGPETKGAIALVVARQLITLGFRPDIYLFNIGGNRLSTECRICRDALKKIPDVNLTEVTETFDMPEINAQWLIVDGLFGRDLKERLAGGFVMLVRYLNESRSPIVSIDLPSGLFSDWNPGLVVRDVVHATLTLAIGFPHICFFMADNASVIGEWKVLDIGLSPEAIRATPTKYHLVEEHDIRRQLRPRPEFSSKADYGDALIIGGSYGMMGAAVLAARGALRAGAGKVSVLSPRCGFNVVQTAVPEAMFIPDKHDIVLSGVQLPRKFTAIGVGPGLGSHEVTVTGLDNFFKNHDKPLVVDADALNCIAKRRDMLNHIPMLSILTPHAGEFDRIFDSHASDESRLLKAVEVAGTYNILILLKGHYTALVRPDGKIYFNFSGNPAMATPGSGDVLTGVLTALMAQNYKPEVASIMAAYIHGVAGDMAAESQGEYGVTAGDIADNIGKAIRRIMK
ncbi:MAG: NAD(P)H-hydrate dehydratase [Clostridium sp.]|nr:NAD(P)H-hydrate dehydratase [Clostridium sp.]